MTYEGAKGETADEMKDVLYAPEDIDQLRLSSARMYNVINKEDKSYKLNTANSLWAQEDYQFLQEYFSTVENYYGGKVENMDFVNKTEQSRQTINKWVEDQTNDRIKELIKEGILSPLTRLVLTNAIYFKGDWEYQFDEEYTSEMDFTASNGSVINSDMMYMYDSDIEFGYFEDENVQVLELPYKDKELSMVVVLPKGNISDIEENLTYENWELWNSSLNENIVEIYFPKFKMETEYSLNEPLSKLGMVSAFMDADFSGMTGKKDLAISAVIHKAFVEVDEKGSEAAAATAVVMKETAMMDEDNIVFKADHPFIFAIRENSTGVVLFLGKVEKP